MQTRSKPERLAWSKYPDLKRVAAYGTVKLLGYYLVYLWASAKCVQKMHADSLLLVQYHSCTVWYTEYIRCTIQYVYIQSLRCFSPTYCMHYCIIRWTCNIVHRIIRVYTTLSRAKALHGATMFNIVVMHICCKSKALLYDSTAPHELIKRAISRSVNTLCTQKFDRSFQHSCATLGFQITHHTRYGVSGPVAHTMHTNTLTR